MANYLEMAKMDRYTDANLPVTVLLTLAGLAGRMIAAAQTRWVPEPPKPLGQG